jgi:hypothetical protein
LAPADELSPPPPVGARVADRLSLSAQTLILSVEILEHPAVVRETLIPEKQHNKKPLVWWN